MNATLERFAYTPFGTFGVLTYKGKSLVTVEKPWLGNIPNESCIPEGMYTCKRYSSARFPDTFEVTEVEGRSHILFHVGNSAKDVKGCIAVGQLLDNKSYRILHSRFAFNQFMFDLYGHEEFGLKVTQFKAAY